MKLSQSQKRPRRSVVVGKRHLRLMLPAFLLVVATLSGCATIRTYADLEPKSINEVRFRDRWMSDYDDEVRVTAAVPSAEEIAALFGKDLVARQIQPVWVKVENHSPHNFYLVASASDPNYYSPIEAAFTVRSGLSEHALTEMTTYFRSLAFRNPVLPNTAVSGFIFTNLDEGEKVVQVTLVYFGEESQQTKSFIFFAQIPDMRVDYRRVDFDCLYFEDEIVEVTEEELKKALEELPCCTTNEDQSDWGDPANLVIIGDFSTVATAFVRRGWLPAEETYANAVWKTIKSFLFGSRYRYSPVSPLYYFGRHQDFARQKPRRDIHERNHLRLWFSKMRFKGKPVFIGQVSRDIGVRFLKDRWPPVTHKIDPDIDEARFSLVEDMLFSQTLAKIGHVRGVGAAPPSKPRKNLTGDPYFTDGLRAVMILEQGPISLDQVRALDWEHPQALRFDSAYGE